MSAVLQHRGERRSGTIAPVVAPHEISAGECISSLALTYGIDPEAIWSAAGNEQLRARRDDPNVLAVGDVVEIPARATKRVSLAANATHVLELQHTHVTLRLRLETAKGPMPDEPYVLTVGGREIEGTTDDDGTLEERIVASATVAELLLVDRAERCRLHIGHLQPVDSWRGVAQRLINLGLFVGDVANDPSPALRAALASFQRERGLEATGELDEPTLDALRQRHGS